jgi:probable rRNA maturation factor
MNAELSIRSRQSVRSIDLRLLRGVVTDLLSFLQVMDFDLAIHLIGESEMTRLNETRLQHAGCTDVITFDYSEPPGTMTGEIFACVPEAVAQAKRFQATWQEELVRYIVHGILHLKGHDDLRPAARRRMKREENRALKQLARYVALNKLAAKRKVTA